jgi:hypothetical protein
VNARIPPRKVSAGSFLRLALAWVDHGPCVALVFDKRAAVRIGWGHDHDLPLRPWPAYHLGRTPKGHQDLCVSWFGLYFGVTVVGMRQPLV